MDEPGDNFPFSDLRTASYFGNGKYNFPYFASGISLLYNTNSVKVFNLSTVRVEKQSLPFLQHKITLKFPRTRL